MSFTPSEMESMLKCIPVATLTYEEWLHVGMALHYEKMPCSIFESWSQSDSRYHAGECEKKWKTFGESDGAPVTGATIKKMAQDRGWNEITDMKTYNWDDVIPMNDIQEKVANITSLISMSDCPDPFDQNEQVRRYLQTLFEPDDHVAYTVKSYKDKDGKYKPTGCNCSRSCQTLLDKLEKFDDITNTLGDYDKEAGAWICFNPVDGEGRNNNNVTAWRYSLIESDTISIEEQWKQIQILRLPIAIVVYTGGKSLHAIVRINAKNASEYSERVNKLYDYCSKNSFPVDKANKNSARLSRLPGVKRGEKWQYIVHGPMGPESYEEWERVVLSPLPVHVIDGNWEKLPPLKPELIHGILRQTHKMMLAGGSKSGKSFNLIQLAICIAEGQPWLGHDCEKGRVLYFNLEIDEASFEHRIKKVYRAMDLQPGGQLDVVTLRGRDIASVDELTKMIQPGIYTAIIIDPFYKIGVEDENAAGDVGKFCRGLDKMAEKTGASVIYCHHHSKGMQSGKNSMDRASGSGVFARDADALIDILEITLPEQFADEAKEKYGQYCIPYCVDFTLREFAKLEPIRCFYSYPLFHVDDDGWLDEARAADVERAMANGRLAGTIKCQIDRDNRKAKLRNAIKRDREFGSVKTTAEYANDLGISLRTVQRYISVDAEIFADFYGFTRNDNNDMT